MVEHHIDTPHHPPPGKQSTEPASEFDTIMNELVTLTNSELDELVRECELQRRRLEAKLAAVVAVAEQRGVPALDGHLSTKSWLRATCNWNHREATQIRSLAHLINHHPTIGRAWADGHIGRPQTEALAKLRRHRRGSQRFTEFVPVFVTQAEQLSYDEFDQVLARYLSLADADGVHDEREAIERRTATCTHIGGELVLSAAGGDATTTAEVMEIFARFEQHEFDTDRAARDTATANGDTPPPFRTGPQRRYDALVRIMRSAAEHHGIATPAAPLVSMLIDEHTISWILHTSGLGTTHNLRNEPVDPFTGLPHPDVTALLDELTPPPTNHPTRPTSRPGRSPDRFPDLLGEPENFMKRRCETTTGVPLRTTDVCRALLSGHIRRVVLGANNRVIDLGRTSRLFTGAARDAARLLTVHCEHPGCDMPASWCHTDHSTEWWQGGTTNQDNARIPCPSHNRQKHQHRWRTQRATNGRSYTIRPNGTIMLPVGCRPPTFDTTNHEAGSGSDPTELDPPAA